MKCLGAVALLLVKLGITVALLTLVGALVALLLLQGAHVALLTVVNTGAVTLLHGLLGRIRQHLLHIVGAP